jgi:hypothetical protein
VSSHRHIVSYGYETWLDAHTRKYRWQSSRSCCGCHGSICQVEVMNRKDLVSLAAVILNASSLCGETWRHLSPSSRLGGSPQSTISATTSFHLSHRAIQENKERSTYFSYYTATDRYAFSAVLYYEEGFRRYWLAYRYGLCMGRQRWENESNVDTALNTDQT